MAIEKNLKNG